MIGSVESAEAHEAIAYSFVPRYSFRLLAKIRVDTLEHHLKRCLELLNSSSRERSHFAGRRRRSGCPGEPATEQNTE
jgi:hypothetical protein